MSIFGQIQGKISELKRQHNTTVLQKAKVKAVKLEDRAAYSKELRQTYEKQDAANREIGKLKKTKRDRFKRKIAPIRSGFKKIKKSFLKSKGQSLGGSGGMVWTGTGFERR